MGESAFAVVGLGNPGPQYARTRHNTGFWVVNLLASNWNADDPQSLSAPWDAAPSTPFREKHGTAYQKLQLAGEEVYLLQPQLFMNRSGEAAVPLLRYFRVPVENTIVVYDELDLDAGNLRVQRGGSSGGHRGVDDLIRILGSGDFFRVRVGIGHPRRKGLAQDVSAYVLSPPTGEDVSLMSQSVTVGAQAALSLINDGLEKTQRRFNRRASQ